MGNGAGKPTDPAQPAQQPLHAASTRAAIAREHQGDLLVTVRVTPRAGKQAIALGNGALRVYLTAPPVAGAANTALIALLSQRLHLPRRAISLTRGTASRDKVLTIAGLSTDAFWTRLGL
jgi:uncharacterized protein (TIGR00251 family)